jgi:hypothetical protein
MEVWLPPVGTMLFDQWQGGLVTLVIQGQSGDVLGVVEDD